MLTRLSTISPWRKPRAARAARASTCWRSPTWWRRGARVLDVGCGDGELLRILETPRRRRPRHRAVARGRERMRRQGPCGGAGRRRHRSGRLSGRCLRLRHPVADLAGDAAAARRARAHAAHRPPRASCRFRISATGASACRSCSAATCRRPTICRTRGTKRPTSTSAASRISASSAGSTGAKMEQAVALNAWGRRMRLKMPWWFWNLFGEQAVFLLSRQD